MQKVMGAQSQGYFWKLSIFHSQRLGLHESGVNCIVQHHTKLSLSLVLTNQNLAGTKKLQI